MAKKRKQNKNHQKPNKKANLDKSHTSHSTATAAAAASSSSSSLSGFNSSFISYSNGNSSSKYSKSNVPLPPLFPHSPNLPLPQNDFLRNIEPYKESFRTAIDTSYEGFAVDQPGGLEKKGRKKCESPSPSYFQHHDVQKALLKMDRHGLFRTDVTQPFGLGTKCAKTYVTRCLLGEEGTTYKYLGLRMFAHPWNIDIGNGTNTTNEGTSSDEGKEINTALKAISTLNQNLTGRTQTHLKGLEQTRQRRNYSSHPCIKGRAKYDVALINRMTNAPDLKKEPTMGKGKCSVSWHADSSLEHFSSIAVYHTIVSDEDIAKEEAASNEEEISRSTQKQANKNSLPVSNEATELATKWSIAMRVAHDSEGPGASRRGSNIDSSVINDSPAVAVSLPPQSAYYLLDDFNHHHQHSVLVNNDVASAGVRFASTHRLLREGHNVNFMLERCRVTCSQFHKKGPKLWRSEQLLLSNIESEWIRQFYIQGEGHKKNLWKYWEQPMCQLLNYWGQLEKRTKQVLDLLTNAAFARCGEHEKNKTNGEPPSKAERKQREKQKKALATVEDLIRRTAGGSNIDDPTEILYQPICVLLEERAKMRSLWTQRENEGVFKGMESEYWPLDVPFKFDHLDNAKSADKEVGISPLGGTSKQLTKICQELKMCARAFLSRDGNHLPAMKTVLVASQQADSTISPVPLQSSSNDEKREGSVVKEKREKDKELLTKKIDEVKEPLAATQQTQETTKKTLKSEESKKTTEETPAIPLIKRPRTTESDHRKDLDWKGWKSVKIGLEMQNPWGRKLLDGTKAIETRAYDLPKSLIGKKIDILQSKGGKDCVSGLSNVMVGEEITNAVQPIGWAIFARVEVYRYKGKFIADEKKHCVEQSSNYGWNDDTKVIYGWVVSKCGRYGKKRKKAKVLLRRMRSLYEIQS